MIDDRNVPGWLAEAQKKVATRGIVEAFDDWPRLAQSGDLRVARPIDPGDVDPRLVVVLGIDPEAGIAEVVLASHETEYASDTEVIVRGTELCLPCDLMIETCQVARLWLAQLGELVSKLDPDISRGVSGAVAAGPGAVPRHMAGLPVVVRDDVRSRFNEDERESLNRLAASCEDEMRRPDSPSRIVIDPCLFRDRMRDTRDQQLERFLRLSEKVGRSSNALTPARAIEIQFEASEFASRSWKAPLWDEYQALVPLYERILTDASYTGGTRVELRPARRDDPDRDADELMTMLSELSQSGCRSVQLITLADAWIGEFPGPIAMAKAKVGDRPSLQIVRCNLEAAS